MKNKMTISTLLLTIAAFTIACQSNTKHKEDDPIIRNPAVFVECKDPRPEICTREYNPVCATRDIGVRCVTTPCPSTEKVTKATACTACSDPKVSGYTPGACE